MLILLVLQLPALARMILRQTSPETAMPDQPDEKRSPAETARLARDVMRRMTQTPPKPHEKIGSKHPRKAKARRK